MKKLILIAALVLSAPIAAGADNVWSEEPDILTIWKLGGDAYLHFDFAGGVWSEPMSFVVVADGKTGEFRTERVGPNDIVRTLKGFEKVLPNKAGFGVAGSASEPGEAIETDCEITRVRVSKPYSFSTSRLVVEGTGTANTDIAYHFKVGGVAYSKVFADVAPDGGWEYTDLIDLGGEARELEFTDAVCFSY